MCVLAVSRSGGHRRRDGHLAARGRPAGDDLSWAARSDRQRRSAGRDLRRDDGPHRRRRPRQGRHHAHRQTRGGRHAVDGDRRSRAAGGSRVGDVGQAQGDRSRHGGQLRRRRHQHRVLPRGGEHGRAVGSAGRLRVPEQHVRRDDADDRHDEDRARRRPGRRLRHARRSRRRQRPAGRCGGARRGGGKGAPRRRPHLHRMRDVPIPRPLLRRPDTVHPQGATGSGDGGRPGTAVPQAADR